MTSTDWAWLIFSSALFMVVWFFIRWTKMHNYRLGRAAFHDGLKRNPKWGAEILQGWDDAQADHNR